VKPASKNAAPKTNAARLLDQMGIQYELRAYEVDPEDLAADGGRQNWVAGRAGFQNAGGAPVGQ
jgi:prolyl-tRNA editing enzyme YbaK/EbsC (Cys-tRNA(Pro) deacylase)